VAVYIPTTGQLERTFLSFEESGFVAPEALEILVRNWQLREGAVRPVTGMLGHTAFLFFAEKPAGKSQVNRG
jgi:tRNA (adenine57-N1/adenine58-N1)-methyltransferase